MVFVPKYHEAICCGLSLHIKILQEPGQVGLPGTCWISVRGVQGSNPVSTKILMNVLFLSNDEQVDFYFFLKSKLYPKQMIIYIKPFHFVHYKILLKLFTF